MANTAVDADVVRDSIKERVRSLGAALGQATPTGMIVVLAGATPWPIVAPLVGAGTVATMATAAVGLLSRSGAGVHLRLPRSACRGARIRRSSSRRRSASGWRPATRTPVALREDVSRLLRSVGGVESALAAADADVKDALARGFAELSGTWQEFGWMLGEVQDRLHEIQARQAEGLALQREGLELQREQLVKTTLLLQLHGAPARSPPEVEPREAPADVLCPYKGLRAFQPEDAAFFFGREALVADVLARLAEARFVAVVGASGSGKSSFVRGRPGRRDLARRSARGHGRTRDHPDARRAPARAARHAARRPARCRRPDRCSTTCARDPERVVLAARQAPGDVAPAATPLVVVDQFEEVFTLCHDAAERTASSTVAHGARPAAAGCCSRCAATSTAAAPSTVSWPRTGGRQAPRPMSRPGCAAWSKPAAAAGLTVNAPPHHPAGRRGRRRAGRAAAAVSRAAGDLASPPRQDTDHGGVRSRRDPDGAIAKTAAKRTFGGLHSGSSAGGGAPAISSSG